MCDPPYNKRTVFQNSTGAICTDSLLVLIKRSLKPSGRAVFWVAAPQTKDAGGEHDVGDVDALNSSCVSSTAAMQSYIGLPLPAFLIISASPN